MAPRRETDRPPEGSLAGGPRAGETIAVIGLGYVGLPVAVAFARELPTIGFDVDARRIAELEAGRDATGEVAAAELASSSLELTADAAELARASFFIVCVPTPIDADLRPDLTALEEATRTVGRALGRGDVVVYESTVYPGVTEEICGPILAAASGLEPGLDFFLGYSPERINPGDSEHAFDRITKVVAADSPETLERVASTYARVVRAGVFRTSSIKVAEAAKVIENTQRDLNIALMNELALIFDRLGIRTRDVLEAAATKWNFLRFSPGLVGGHCIGVDPYYLTTKAEELGYQPQVILSGRRINNAIGAHVAQKAIKLLAARGVAVPGARVGVLGLSFKEDVPDLRNSQVPNIVAELREFGLDPLVHDPIGSPEAARREHGLELVPWERVRDLDAVILAVAHRFYLERKDELLSRVQPRGVVIDVKSVLDPEAVGDRRYWSL